MHVSEFVLCCVCVVLFASHLPVCVGILSGFSIVFFFRCFHSCGEVFFYHISILHSKKQRGSIHCMTLNISWVEMKSSNIWYYCPFFFWNYVILLLMNKYSYWTIAVVRMSCKKCHFIKERTQCSLKISLHFYFLFAFHFILTVKLNIYNSKWAISLFNRTYWHRANNMWSLKTPTQTPITWLTQNLTHQWVRVKWWLNSRSTQCTSTAQIERKNYEVLTQKAPSHAWRLQHLKLLK